MKDITTFILEEINRWSTASKFESSLNNALSYMDEKSSDIIIELLDGGFDDLDSQYKKNKKLIIIFLSNMYPTETFLRKSDVDIIDRMHELQEIYKKFNK